MPQRVRIKIARVGFWDDRLVERPDLATTYSIRCADHCTLNIQIHCISYSVQQMSVRLVSYFNVIVKTSYNILAVGLVLNHLKRKNVSSSIKRLVPVFCMRVFSGTHVSMGMTPWTLLSPISK